tara:strand:+ start:7940 stop:9064 length:1125 start_codon:yes stop_codon:yes gene_type:complete
VSTFLERVLEPPHYGYERNGKLYVPSNKEILVQFLSRMNIFKSKKNWLPFSSWLMTLLLLIPLYIFAVDYFSWKLLVVGFFYSMVGLGTHGTVYLHRYCSHRAYRFRTRLCRFVVKNLTIKVIPEEIYAVSHLVHHKFSEKPGDPYNVYGGWLYCFLADAIHNPISTRLDKKDYHKLSKFMTSAGLKTNSYDSYQKYGSLTPPLYFFMTYFLNWTFWYTVFFLIGGHALATCLFGSAAIWGIGVRTFNYDGHGGGKDKKKEGIDFLKTENCINQVWAGYVSGEWHNNHHLYPNGARAGFLRYQLDLAWLFILGCYKMKLVTQLNDPYPRFIKEHYEPYLKSKGQKITSKETPLSNTENLSQPSVKHSESPTPRM